MNWTAKENGSDWRKWNWSWEKSGKINLPKYFKKKLKEVLKTQLLKQFPELQKESEEQKEFNSRHPQDERKSLELLIYQLQNGRKPWWASQSKKEGIRNLVKKLISEKNRSFLLWLKSESFSQVMLNRLANHLEVDEIQKKSFP